MESKDLERLAKLETQLESMGQVMLRLEAKFDAWQTNFLTRVEADEMFRSRDKEIQNVREDLKEAKLDKRSNFALVPAYISLGVSIVIGLVMYFK
ncbi:hypothetical protein ABE65_010270 [Fictibacillus phosphorivorans]|uniref:Uncharacterized protein n=1 Tax=Fictibacillus phosphorivorans TaxID=1221500 RepID=A0A160IM31_9BACL|nr:hypothetical protein [Fictibacillus phosphorivorans]ANC77164.1 hypothetical protein ABE65_010270 [Fictibacillus phosphorivorans]